MTADMHGQDAAADLRASTLRVVQYVLKLKLPRAGWERVAEAITAAAAAAVADDLEGLRRAADELMLVSPVRIIKGDAGPAEPADQKIFERANVLIVALQPMRPAATQDTDGKGR